MFHRHFHHVGWSGTWWPGFWLFLIGFVVLAALLTVLIVLVARRREAHRAVPAGADRGTGPQRILAERYARGELDEEEYRRRLEILREPPGPDPSG
ncbi:SHOCT domain-containing protein [Kitasatospora sp. NPDC058965]|uniref:SHOCT domain-containing protein n=1 Tax=Kitasatospora sp. NPDC058965 TaxID=3346682 RepID=UPI003681215D